MTSHQSLISVLDKLESGKRPKGGVKGITTGIPSIGGEHLNNQGGFNFSNVKYVPIDFASSMNKGNIQKGDILIVKDGATTAKTSYVGNDFPYDHAVINEHVFLCRANEKTNSRYLFYYLWSEQGKRSILEDFRGAAQGGISTNFAKKVNLPIPSLEDQNKIVAKIEELFSELDNTDSLINTAIKARKTYLQSMLKELYTLKANWKEVKSQNLFSYVTSGSRGWAKYYSEEPDKPYFLRVTNVNYETIDLDLREEKLKYVDLPQTVEGRRTLVQPGDILISITGYVGMVGIVPLGIPEAYISQHISLARPIAEVNPKYIAYYLISKTGGLRQLELLQKGATKAGLTLADIKNVVVPVAPREEQDKIVDTIDQVMSEIASLNNELTTLKERATSLRQSILSKAFKGELV